MKKIVLAISLVVAFAMSAFAQNEPEITFEKSTAEFGDIKQGQVVNATFKFKNTGKSPLVLQNVQSTCGCTVPSWPKDPIAPGKSAEITATFNSAGKMGQQNKVITIFSNAKTSQSQVSIICNVLPPDPPATEPAPQAAPPKN
ncbi:MAG: DUF1573 domain-containing protein [Bacteroidota bacterium]|nr:DUF1573 domain-containing protein [Bacteroidota bacterium]